MIRSSLATEAWAVLDGVDSALYNAALLNKLISDKPEQKIPIHCTTDNKSFCNNLASN